MDDGDAKVSGRAVEMTDPDEFRAFVEATQPPQPCHVFRCELDEAVFTTVDPVGEQLVVQLWRPGTPVVRSARRGTEYPPRRLETVR
ncbi:hypothetical protein GCM10012275_57970 [Longimycelium tulufanense]|uniref:Uncharacterized protein n=1 Tax=Longimycelium tulufanense TaxID=907463 RepID=A0A8J3CJS3_9PSEU|nr:hypothetical protein [Longimycelium tulufanense]GGM79753.1 hypothetical protein GCM10012275_57970 [Longimycelium tulufanense]